jgi:hypothetical protein
MGSDIGIAAFATTAQSFYIAFPQFPAFLDGFFTYAAIPGLPFRGACHLLDAAVNSRSFEMPRPSGSFAMTLP